MNAGTGLLKERFPSCRSAIALASTADADVKLSEYGTAPHSQLYTIDCLTAADADAAIVDVALMID